MGALSRPRVLIVKPVVPYPPNQGTRVVSFELIRALSEAFDVTVVTRTLSDEDELSARELEQWCERVEDVPAPNRKSVLHRVGYKLWYSIVSLVTRRSMKSLYDCPGALVRRVRNVVARTQFDLVIVEYWQLYPLLDILPADKTVLLTHDIDLLVARKRALLERRLFKKLSTVRRWLAEQREEVKTYQRVQRVLALTERDAEAVRKLSKGRAHVDVLPFGLDVDGYAAPDVKRSPKEVLFMGALSAGFNIDALEFFVQQIVPHLDAPDIRFTVVGGELPPTVAHFARDSRVDVTGRVDDITTCLARATCLVVPLRYGGGLRIRILEAMMAGTPVVSTAVGIAGMDFVPGRDFLLADESAAFAAHVVRLLEDTELAGNLSVNAAKRVRERYAAGEQRRRLIRLVQSYINK